MPFSVLAAFLGGLISLLSPCSALVLPGFLANSLGQKKLYLATIIFALGVLSVTLPLGLGAVAMVQYLSRYRQAITTIIGMVLIVEAILQFFNQSLFGFHWRYRITNAYVLGLASGIGAIACVGPILGAIITLAFNQAHFLDSFWLIISYNLGLIGPLFLLTWLWQKNNVWLSQLLRGKLIHWAAAIFLLILGIVFIKYQGVLSLTPEWVFDLQDKLFTL
ncbi:MAG: cytochrome c biogenesis protein CcdA [Patescibacteria group bacterium]|nr:hypothetical protein [Patescibacteria group bacterium]MDP4031205.1 cytochrome c biogenesis protein CcdA [Candidatus Beckwithbacteria bacterium]MDZ4229062.1 cytochrome c biogenesis protein CcdA [Patescibacteria group bacterium]